MVHLPARCVNEGVNPCHSPHSSVYVPCNLVHARNPQKAKPNYLLFFLLCCPCIVTVLQYGVRVTAGIGALVIDITVKIFKAKGIQYRMTWRTRSKIEMTGKPVCGLYSRGITEIDWLIDWWYPEVSRDIFQTETNTRVGENWEVTKKKKKPDIWEKKSLLLFYSWPSIWRTSVCRISDRWDRILDNRSSSKNN